MDDLYTNTLRVTHVSSYTYYQCIRQRRKHLSERTSLLALAACAITRGKNMIDISISKKLCEFYWIIYGNFPLGYAESSDLVMGCGKYWEILSVSHSTGTTGYKISVFRKGEGFDPNTNFPAKHEDAASGNPATAPMLATLKWRCTMRDFEENSLVLLNMERVREWLRKQAHPAGKRNLSYFAMLDTSP